MGRRRVLVLAPAITRMQCMSNPYKRIEGGDKAVAEMEPSTTAVVRRTTTTSFWSSWRKRKSAKKKKSGMSTGGARRRGFRVTKLRIRMLSPLFWLKKVRDSYVNMMLAIERSAPHQECSGMVTCPAYVYRSQGAVAGAPWMFPTFAPPVVF